MRRNLMTVGCGFLAWALSAFVVGGAEISVYAQDSVTIAHSDAHPFGRRLQFSWMSEPGSEYALQRSGVSGKWEDVKILVAVGSITFLVIEDDAAQVVGSARASITSWSVICAMPPKELHCIPPRLMAVPMSGHGPLMNPLSHMAQNKVCSPFAAGRIVIARVLLGRPDMRITRARRRAAFRFAHS